MEAPAFIAPELARKIGWATQSDALLYVNMKGVAVSSGKRTAQIVGVVFFVVVVAAIIALLIAQNKGGRQQQERHAGGDGRRRRHGGADGRRGGGGGGERRGQRARGADHRARGARRWGGAVTAARAAAGTSTGRRRACRPSIGVGVMVPIGSDQHTHPSDGSQVVDEDELFAGDEIRVSMTLVSAHDGRVLWHIRDSVDVAPDKPPEVDAFVRKYMDLIPPSLAAGPAGDRAARRPRQQAR